jgi:hypothetical protein
MRKGKPSKHGSKATGIGTSSIASFQSADSGTSSKASFHDNHGSKRSLKQSGSKGSTGSGFASHTSFDFQSSSSSKFSLHGSSSKAEKDQFSDIGLSEVCMLSAVLKGEEDVAIDFINSG